MNEHTDSDAAFEKALAETRSEYREALDRLSDGPTAEKDACTCGWDKPRGPICPDCGGRTLWPDSPHSEGSDEESIRERWTCDTDPDLPALLAEARKTFPPTMCRLGPTEHDGSRFCHAHVGRVHPGSPTPWQCEVRDA